MAYLLLQAFNALFYLVSTLILVRVLISWVPPMYQSHVGQLIVAFTEPVLAPCRRLLMRIPALARLPIDFSPILAWVLLGVVQAVVNALFKIL